MAIYVFVEVARRELEGRLLLSLVAAERGHDVVLGKISHSALLRQQMGDWRTPPGVLHLKSIAGSPRLHERIDRLRADGSLVSVQDEEHGLAGPVEYEEFGEQRFSPESLDRVDRIMAWGEHDAQWFRERRSESTVVATGSPRIDLWRPEVIEGTVAASAHPTPYLLFVSSITPFGRNPLWVRMFNARAGAFGPGFSGDDDPVEFRAYDDISAAYLHVKHVVQAVRRAAREFPQLTIVVRPHHFEEARAWEGLVGNYPNVRFDAESTSRQLVAHAAMVVHCGSSMAIEARVAQRDVMTFCPVSGFWSDWGSNRLGFAASTVDAVVDGIRQSVASDWRSPLAEEESEFLSTRLAALDGPLAAERIVDEWERMMTPEARSRVERVPQNRSVGEQIRRPIRAVRNAVRGIVSRGAGPDSAGHIDKGPFAMEVEHKFPSLDVDALRADARRLSDHLGRFKDVEIIQIGEREVLLRAAGR